ncbi:MAG: cell division protein ZapA [Alphaproteobacteria bacterium]
MAQVNVVISGRSYRIACEDGQEEHLQGLALKLDQSIDQLRDRFGEIGDQRLTVMAAITLADQVDDMERRLARMETEVAGLEEARAAIAEREAASEERLIATVEAVATKVETMARSISHGRSPGER